MITKKTRQLRIRLSSSVEGSACQVPLSEEEYIAVRNMAITYGFGATRGVSSFIRRLAELAAGPSECYHDVHSLLTDAASKAGVSLGAFMRLCVLEAIGKTQLKTQLTALTEGVANGSARA
jgi:hypothetical protein